MNENLNENLKKIVLERTQKLKFQNTQLPEYAFVNAYKLRSPLASTMGLVDLVKDAPLNSEQSKLINYLIPSHQQFG